MGLVAAGADADDGTVRHLMACWVEPDARGSGVGDALVEAMVTWSRRDAATRARVEVYQHNAAAMRLYERHGFRRTGTQHPVDEQGRLRVELERDL